MRAWGRKFSVLTGVLLFAGCAASETRSLVSKEDIPANKYQKVAVFIENLDGADHAAEEWKRPPREWFEAKTQFAVMFNGRFVNA